MTEKHWPALSSALDVDVDAWRKLAMLSRPLDSMAHDGEAGRLIEAVAVAVADGDIAADDVRAVRARFGLQ